MDYTVPPLFNALIYTFPCATEDRDRIFTVLEQGLAQLIADEPGLAADVVRDTTPTVRPGTMKVVETDDAAPIIRLERRDLDQPESGWPAEQTYAWLREKGMPISRLDGRLLAPWTASMEESTTKVMAARISFIDGGALLAAGFAHAVTDAWGINLILAAWAARCRHLQGVQGLPNGCIELPRLDFSGGKQSALCTTPPRVGADWKVLEQRDELWRALCLHPWNGDEVERHQIPPTSIPAAAAISGHGTNLQTCMFAFDSTALSQLKADASSSSQWISTADALTALLWRHVMRARFPPGGHDATTVSPMAPPNPATTTISIAVNGRNAALRPAIPQSFPGNSIFFALTDLPLPTLLRSSLSEIARTLRASILSVRNDGALLADAVALAASLPDVRFPKIRMSDYLGLHFSTVNWTEMPWLRLSFGPIFDNGRPDGNGTAEFFRMPNGQFGGICGLFPRRPDGTIEVTMGLQADQINRLLQDDEFTTYARIISQ
jgi:hypothetical protein